jgi:hypothetical protein
MYKRARAFSTIRSHLAPDALHCTFILTYAFARHIGPRDDGRTEPCWRNDGEISYHMVIQYGIAYDSRGITSFLRLATVSPGCKGMDPESQPGVD